MRIWKLRDTEYNVKEYLNEKEEYVAVDFFGFFRIISGIDTYSSV